jgi:sigma-E factor negative regulatory protein RseC
MLSYNSNTHNFYGKDLPVLNCEQGIIEKTMDGKAIVRIRRRSSCAGCGSRGNCEISNKETLVEVLNDISAKAGDYVELTIPEGAVLKLSLLVYILPIIGLIIGAFLGEEAAKQLRVDTPVLSVMGGAMLMVITFFFLRRLDRKSGLDKKYQPRIRRIIKTL